MKLKLSKDVELPLDVATETLAVLGRRGSGKSYGAGVLVEELLDAGIQVVVIDPTDVWYGLRSSADGKGDGFPIVVFGGNHADVPLEPGAGKILADLIIDQGMSAILCVRLLSKQQQRDLVAGFCERLYERKGKADAKAPLHLVIDEADEFVPQRTSPGTARSYGAVDTIVRRGRSSGLGTTLISQRSAVLSKDVLTQTEVLICYQTTGPQDRVALKAWIDANDDDNRGDEFLNSLASLPKGTGWIWSPTALRVFHKFTARNKKTFDSGATPKVGERRIEPKRLTPVDLDKIKTAIASTIAKADADNPARLRGRIAELEKQLRNRPDAIDSAKVIQEARERAALLLLSDIEPIGDLMREAFEKLCARVEDRLKHISSAAAKATIVADWKALKAERSTLNPFKANDAKNGRVTPAPAAAVSTSDLSKGERACLLTIAQLGEVTRQQLTVQTGYKRSTRDAYLQRLRIKNYIQELCNDSLSATLSGREALGAFETLPVGEELREHWKRTLPEGESRIFCELERAYPKFLERERISEILDYARSSRDAYIQRLRSRCLCETNREGVRLSNHLYMES